MTLLEDNIGRKSMTNASTLSDFITYCTDNYPADRYMLVMWDHGGGSISGFGYDEIFPGKSMTLDKIGTALKDSGCKFDIIGFDACLMATLETAITIEPYADYLIASEETEPGKGWYYTNWLNALSKNTSMSSLDIGKNIIDDFIVSYKDSPRDKTTLSLVDLAELKGTIPETFSNFSKASAKLIDNDEYKVISDARSKTREFSPQSKINQIDLVHFAKNIGTKEAEEFSDALLSCIKYNRTSSNISNAFGLSIYFPYNKLNTVDKALETYEKIGINEEYSSCVKSFSNLIAGGQIVSNSTGNPLSSLLGSAIGQGSSQNAVGTLISSALGSGSTQDIVGSLLGSFLGGGDFSSITGLLGDVSSAWFDPDKISEMQKYYESNYLNADDIVLSEKNGGYVLSMTDENWDLVQEVELNVFFDDGEGYIDLGLDNVYEFDDDGDLLIDYDGTWLSINDHIIAYYMISDDRKDEQYTITGRVPAMLNDELVNIILIFDNENPYGIVAGASTNYDESVTETIAKGLVKLKKGDKIDFLCDYYTYDGEFINSYYLGEQMTVDGELTINNINVGDNLCKVTYRLTDIYNNKYWTPYVEY